VQEEKIEKEENKEEDYLKKV